MQFWVQKQICFFLRFLRPNLFKPSQNEFNDIFVKNTVFFCQKQNRIIVNQWLSTNKKWMLLKILRWQDSYDRNHDQEFYQGESPPAFQWWEMRNKRWKSVSALLFLLHFSVPFLTFFLLIQIPETPICASREDKFPVAPLLSICFIWVDFLNSIMLPSVFFQEQCEQNGLLPFLRNSSAFSPSKILFKVCFFTFPSV